MIYNKQIEGEIKTLVENCVKEVYDQSIDWLQKDTVISNILYNKCTFKGDLRNVTFKDCAFTNCTFEGTLINTSFDGSTVEGCTFDCFMINNSLYDAKYIYDTDIKSISWGDEVIVLQGEQGNKCIIFPEKKVLYINYLGNAIRLTFDQKEQISGHIVPTSVYGKMILSLCEG